MARCAASAAVLAMTGGGGYVRLVGRPRRAFFLGGAAGHQDQKMIRYHKQIRLDIVLQNDTISVSANGGRCCRG